MYVFIHLYIYILTLIVFKREAVNLGGSGEYMGRLGERNGRKELCNYIF